MARSMCDYVLQTAGKETLLEANSCSEIARHLDVCPRCREAVERKVAIAELCRRTELDPIAARRMAVRVLSGTPREAVRSGLRWRSLVWASVAGAMVAVLGVYLYLVVFRDSESMAPAPPAAPVADTPKQPLKRAVNPEPKPIDTADGPKTVTLGNKAKVWFNAETKATLLVDSEKLSRTRLTKGRIVVEIPKRIPGYRFVVLTPHAEVESLGTIFSVDVRGNGVEMIRVVKSAVVVRPHGGAEPVVVRAGEELSLGTAAPRGARSTDLAADLCLVRGECDHAAVSSGDVPTTTVKARKVPEPRPSDSKRSLKDAAVREDRAERIDQALASGDFDTAEQLLFDWQNGGDERLRRLLRLAVAFRNTRQFLRAVKVYERIFTAYPGRDAAINGLISVAQIKQGMLGDSAGAIRYYDRYLGARPQGSLAEAASAGRIRALYTMGRYDAVVKASGDYMRLHAGGVSEREVLQKRKRALTAIGR